MFPVVVSHVCRAWRSLALCTPWLWRRIHLDHRMDMWTERVHRAKACSLDVKLLPLFVSSGTVYRQFLDPSTAQWYMYLIVPTIQRWRSLEIRFTHYTPFLWNAALTELCSRSSKARAAPNLEELTLVYPSNDDAKEFCLFSGFAPRLKRVTIDGVRLSWTPSLFQNLTYLDYSHHGFTAGTHAIHEMISLLRISSRLEELVICWPSRRGVDSLLPQALHSPALRRVTLPYLRTLRLKVDSSDIPRELVHLMPLMYTPGLLFIHCIDLGRSRQPFPSLQTFIRTFPFPTSTQILSLEHGWYNDVTLFSLLNRLPHLQQVFVKHLHLPDKVFHVYPQRII